MKVVGDLAHHLIHDPTCGPESLFTSVDETGQHRCQLIGGRLGSVPLPHHHRCRAHFAVGYPAQLVFEVPVREPGCLAQFAFGIVLDRIGAPVIAGQRFTSVRIGGAHRSAVVQRRPVGGHELAHGLGAVGHQGADDCRADGDAVGHLAGFDGLRR